MLVVQLRVLNFSRKANELLAEGEGWLPSVDPKEEESPCEGVPSEEVS